MEEFSDDDKDIDGSKKGKKPAKFQVVGFLNLRGFGKKRVECSAKYVEITMGKIR